MNWSLSKRSIGNVSERLLLVLVVALSTAAVAQNTSQNGPSTSSNGASTKRLPRQILVSISDRRLAVLESGKVVRTFPISVGAAVSPSPTGEFQIVNRLSNPTFRSREPCPSRKKGGRKRKLNDRLSM